MRKSIIAILLLTSLNTSYSLGTVIQTYNPVQCNKWGWINHYIHTVWNYPCTPLEVKSLDGSKIFSIPTTAKQCHANQYAYYYFTEGDAQITFAGCRSMNVK